MYRLLLGLLFVAGLFAGSNCYGVTSKSGDEKGKVFADFNHDYSQTLVMKLFLSKPDSEGKPMVANTFEDAMEIIKITDELTLGVPKIIYLVGWQYNGHDDKYPAFFGVNEALKREQDATARESLIWLMEEARKYHTVVSLHINMTDAYDDSPLWPEYVENDLISKTPNGNLMVIGNYNNRKAYQINYKNEWERGYAKMRIDRLLDILPPLRDGKTIHIDAWIVRDSKGHYESAVTEAKYQQKVLAYWNQQGIDATSEWVMDYMIGKIPFAWHFNHFSQEDYLQYPASVYTGSGLNRDLEYSDFGLGFLFGKSMYGENIFPQQQKNPNDDEWKQKFVDEFYLNCLQYFFLNRHVRIKVEGEGDDRVAYFSDNVRVSLADSTVHEGPRLLREKDFVAFPVSWKTEKCLAVYSKKTVERSLQVPECWGEVKRVAIREITASEDESQKVIQVTNGRFSWFVEAGIPYLISPEI
ncbi:endo-alpha-N-acetylgalactosaminidase family protein [Sunxiuqinia sp. sy24]|uniref:endo-alpha-N-acetylgalactosaminidase family protein n=1 Tax=Sunxiuqinia sp. sy24 TaxID=3461495 RepID=UPI004045BECB